jgi:hypothetical protein
MAARGSMFELSINRRGRVHLFGRGIASTEPLRRPSGDPCAGWG